MSDAGFFYENIVGRALLGVMMRTGCFKLAEHYLKSGLSKGRIAKFIVKNGIDMSPYGDKEYKSFAEFFSRKKDGILYDFEPDVLISPCDGLLSIYKVSKDSAFPVKGSLYRVSDVIEDENTASLFNGGMCFIFRLEASDYHHLCAFDDLEREETHYIPGKLHSVQPVACERYPVYRLNRRWWTLLHTKNFGDAVQVEVGAMAVGGVSRTDAEKLKRAEDMGAFELAGSTVMLFLTADVCNSLDIYEKLYQTLNGEKEVRLSMGEGIGRLMHEKAE